MGPGNFGSSGSEAGLEAAFGGIEGSIAACCSSFVGEGSVGGSYRLGTGRLAEDSRGSLSARLLALRSGTAPSRLGLPVCSPPSRLHPLRLRLLLGSGAALEVALIEGEVALVVMFAAFGILELVLTFCGHLTAAGDSCCLMATRWQEVERPGKLLFI